MTAIYRLFGTPEITREGVITPLLQSPKGLAIVAYLIVSNQIQSREKVADLFWEASSSAQSLKNLRSLLGRIHPFVPELQITRQTLNFQLEEGDFVDILEVLRVLDSENPVQLASGLVAYRGPFLDGIYLHDAPRFDEWLILTREQLRNKVRQAYARLCNMWVSLKDFKSGLVAAQRWLELDLLDEKALQTLMKMYLAVGDPAAGLHEFDLFHKRLWEELALEPESITLNLVEQLQTSLTAQDQMVLMSPALPEPSILAEPGPLPSNAFLPYHRNITFTGREDYLLQLAERLLPRSNDGLTKAMVVTGIGGLGKTQLTVEYAYRYGRFYPGGVYWLSFADPESVAVEIATLGGERGMKLYRQADQLTQDEQITRVKNVWQEPISRLLIFDNCEDVLLAADWLPVSGGCSVLMTSRQGMWPLEMPLKELPLEVLSPVEGTKLLRQLACHLTEEAAVEVVVEVGGLPLALQLAGHYLAQHEEMGVQTYLAQLRKEALLHHASLKGKFSRYSPTGHDLHVARTFALSYEQLDKHIRVDVIAQALLARAACFAPGNPVPETLLLRAVTGEEEEPEFTLLAEMGLRRLVALGLLNRVGDASVIMHRLVAAFTQDRIDEYEREQAEKAVNQQVVAVLNETHRQKGTLYFLPFPVLHLRHLTRAGLSSINEGTVELFYNFTIYLINIRDYTAAIQYAQRMLEVSHEVYGKDHLMTVNALNVMGTIYFNNGGFSDAIPLYQRAVEVCEHVLPANHPTLARAYHNLGNTLGSYGDYEKACDYLRKAVTIDEASWDPKTDKPPNIMANRLNSLGYLLMEIGQYEEALIILQRALSIREELHGQDSPLIGLNIYHLGRWHLKNCQFEQARTQIERGKELLVNGYGEDHPILTALSDSLGVLYTKLGDYKLAKSYLEKALAKRLPSYIYRAETLVNLGELYELQGDLDLAHTYYQQVMDLLDGKVLETHLTLQRAKQGLG